MPDFYVDTQTLAPHEAAVVYMLERLLVDADFAWVMWGTQSLALLIEAEAARRGITVEEMEEDLERRRSERKPPREADIPRLRDRLDKLRTHICGMVDRGRLSPQAASVPLSLTDYCPFIPHAMRDAMHAPLPNEVAFSVEIRRRTLIGMANDWAERWKALEAQYAALLASGEPGALAISIKRECELRNFMQIVAGTAPDELLDLDVATVLTEAARAYFDPRKPITEGAAA